jgi:hypothetical protein
VNKSQFQRCLNFRVRLRPIARRFMGQRELKAIDDDWLVAKVGTSAKGVEIHNPRTGHVVQLAYDQIHHFAEDIARDWNGLSHGFFELRGQLTLSGPRASHEPLPSYCPNCGVATSRSKAPSSKRSSATVEPPKTKGT